MVVIGALPTELTEQIAAWKQRMRAAGHSPETVRTRTVALRSFIGAGGDALAPQQEEVVDWLAGQSAQWTRLTYHSAMKAWCLHLCGAGVLEEDDNPMLWVKRPRTPKRHPRPISDHDLALVLEHCQGRTRSYVLLASFAGLRVSEVARMRGELVTERSIRVVGKGGTEQYVPTHPVLWRLAQRLPRRGWWFDSPRLVGHVDGRSVGLAIGRAMQAAGVDGTAHQLRHSFATRLLRAGVDARVVQEAMRHASLATTAGYLAVDDDRLAEGVARLRMPAA